MTSDHFMRIEPGLATVYLVCQAPENAPCHAAYDCDCEYYYHAPQQPGTDRPVHLSESGNVHVGRWGKGCSLADWFDAMDYPLDDTALIVPVVAEWDDEGYHFDILGGKHVTVEVRR